MTEPTTEYRVRLTQLTTAAVLLQNTVDKLVQRANASFLVSTSSWTEQFVDAITVSAGEREGMTLRLQPPKGGGYPCDLRDEGGALC